MALSCEVKGELKYIFKFGDFQECMEPSVYEALKEFFGADEDDGNYAEKLREAYYQIGELETDNEMLDDENDTLQYKLEDAERQIEKLEQEVEQTEIYKEKLNEIAKIIKEDKQ